MLTLCTSGVAIYFCCITSHLEFNAGLPVLKAGTPWTDNYNFCQQARPELGCTQKFFDWDILMSKYKTDSSYT